MPARFLQLHCLTSYPAALLNRDDAGFAKRIPFGGVTRTRISSQCLKRHWRTFDGEHGLHELEVPGSIRSRITFERLIFEPLRAEGIATDMAEGVTRAIMDVALGKSKKKEAGKKGGAKKGAETDDGAEKNGSLKTEQLTVLGRPEVEFLLGEARAICKSTNNVKEVAAAVEARLKAARKNLDAMTRAAGLDAALFGRMVTSDILARGDAAIHVAHAFTVHGQATEDDYFSAVDELLRDSEDEQQGSGHINTAELTSGLYYTYVVVDVPLLVSNLEGCAPEAWQNADRTLAGEVVRRFVHLLATVSPGAKRGSTAPYAHAHLVMAEAGTSQPRTLANAFLAPVRETPDVVSNAYGALREHMGDLDAMYGARTARRLAGIGPAGELAAGVTATRGSLLEVAGWAAEQVVR